MNLSSFSTIWFISVAYLSQSVNLWFSKTNVSSPQNLSPSAELCSDSTSKFRQSIHEDTSHPRSPDTNGSCIVWVFCSHLQVKIILCKWEDLYKHCCKQYQSHQRWGRSMLRWTSHLGRWKCTNVDKWMQNGDGSGALQNKNNYTDSVLTRPGWWADVIGYQQGLEWKLTNPGQMFWKW